jgi:hypothetical protein
MLKSDSFLVKPYVKEYLINNFGEQVVIPEDHFIMAAWRICAQRKKKMREKLYKNLKESKNFGDSMLVPVCITLSKHTYVNYGFYLTATEEVVFRNMLEKMVKQMLDTTCYITSELKPEMTRADAIDVFREFTKVSEESFSYEATNKYIYRRNKRNKPEAPQGLTLFNHADRNHTTSSR